MDPQITQALITLFTTEGWSKYAFIIPFALGSLHILLQVFVMPNLTVPEANSPVWYKILFTAIAWLTVNIGKNAPVPNSMLKNPKA